MLDWLTGTRVWGFVKAVVLKYLADDGLTRGAAIAFYTVTSIGPVLVIVVAIVGLAMGGDTARESIVAQINSLMGPEAGELIRSALIKTSDSEKGLLATLIGAGTLLLTASGVFGEMQTALNVIWKAEPGDQPISRLVRARAASVGLVTTFGFLLMISLVISAGLSALSERLDAILPFGSLILTILNGVISFVLISVLFGAVFKVLPDVPLRWRDVAFGAAITGVLFTAGKALIGWYLGTSGIASGYGAAGGLIVLLFWVYYSAQIFLLGAEITCIHSGDPRQKERPKRVAASKDTDRPL